MERLRKRRIRRPRMTQCDRWPKITRFELRTHAVSVRRLANTIAIPAIVATTPTIGLRMIVWGFW